MYINLFHGRKYPEKEMEDWGEQGPIIGPVALSWTYGGFKIHKPGWGDEFEFVKMGSELDLIYFDGMYYGDMEVLEDNDLLLLDPANKKRVISFDRFIKINDYGTNSR